MDLRDLMRALRTHWILLASVFVLALAIAGGITWQTTPTYTASTRLFVSTPGNTDAAAAYQGDLFSQQRVTSYAELLRGKQLAERVIDSLNLDMTPEALSSAISASVVPQTVILEATVTDPSPAQAQRIANALGVEFTGLVTELETPPGQDVATVTVTVVETADLPTTPVSPSLVINFGLAAAIGLLAGIALVGLREQLDNTVKRPEDVEALTNDAAVIGGVLHDPDLLTKPITRQLRGQSRTAEAFRQIRTNLQFLNVDNPPRVIVVSSSVPGEGKTTIAISLALVLAQSGQRVCLVEGDLRRPRVTQYLRIVGGAGLTNVLAGVASLEDVLQPVGDGKLAVLGSGPTPPNPSEMLASTHMRQLIVDLRQAHDYVVIDSSPLLPVTDAAVLGALSDGVVLVTRYGVTKREQLRQSVQMLRSVDAHLLGVVLNMVPIKHGAAEGYGYGYGYEADKPQRESAVRSGAKRHSERGRSAQRDPRPVVTPSQAHTAAYSRPAVPPTGREE